MKGLTEISFLKIWKENFKNLKRKFLDCLEDKTPESLLGFHWGND